MMGDMGQAARRRPGGVEPGGADVWHCRHIVSPGSVDETARRVSHEELAVASLLAAEGHHVLTVPERRGARTPDLVVCGTSVEVKSFQSLAERPTGAPRAKQVANKLLDARGQGAVAFIWAGRSGLTADAARQGYMEFCDVAAREGLGRLRMVRVVGDGFDLALPALQDVLRSRRELGPGWLSLGAAPARGARPGGARPGGALRPAPPGSDPSHVKPGPPARPLVKQAGKGPTRRERGGALREPGVGPQLSP